MNIKRVSLTDFRNIQSADVALEPGVNIIEGLNAQGKSNFLESIYLCATGRSYRGASNREMTRHGQAEAYARVRAAAAYGDTEIAVCLRRDGAKTVLVNGAPIGKLGELFGRLAVVAFSPEDLRLVKSGPAERRRFMDMELCQLEPVYYSDLRRYYKALKQRGSLLKALKQPTQEAAKTLPVWDEQLAVWGLRVSRARAAFMERVSRLAGEAHASMCAGEALTVQYHPSVPYDITPEDYAKRLAKNAERDIFLSATSIGAHKDDFLFAINGKDARAFASQGQCRTAALSLKLAEIALIKREKLEAPVLLLDDVFSELDAPRQMRLLHALDGLQAIVTCTGAEGALPGITKNAAVYTVSNGELSRVDD